jgi:RNA polymerase sigma-70 factor (ECF subfamily)
VNDVRSEAIGTPFSEAAFERLHTETFPSVWAMARRICQDESEAQDIAQIAYLGVYRYWREGKLREAPRRLLFRIAQRAAADVLRGRARRQRLFAALPKNAISDWPERDLHDALRTLKPQDATLVLLQATAGLTYEELAAVQRQSVAAVRSRLYRARAQLRRALTGGR